MDYKIVVGVPCMDMIPIQTAGSLMRLCMKYPSQIKPYMVSGSLVYEARNQIIMYALQENADYVLFVDSDICFDENALQRLLDRNVDIVSGLYYGRRKGASNPIAYDDAQPQKGKKQPFNTPIKDIDTGYRRVKAVGLGFCLIKVSCIKTIIKKFKRPFEPYKGLGEDLSFFWRITTPRPFWKPIDVYLDTTIPLTHYGMYGYDKTDYLRERM